MQNAFVVEHAHQVDDILCRGIEGEAHWLAVGPSAIHRLRRADMPYEIPENFFDTEALAKVCEDSHDRLWSLCDRVDQWIWAHHPRLESLAIRPMRFHFFPLVQLFDVLRSRSFIFERLAGAFPTSTLWVHYAEPSIPTGDQLGFRDRDTLWGLIGRMLIPESRIRVLPEPLSTAARRPPWYRISPRAEGKRLAKHSIVLATMARYIGRRDLPGLLHALAPGSRRSLLVVGAPVEWNYALPALRDAGFRMLFTDYELFHHNSLLRRAQGFRLPAELEDDPSVNHAFLCGGSSLYPILRDRVGWIVNESPRILESIAHAVPNLLRRYRVASLLTSAMNSALAYTVNQSARRAGVPVVAWQHGLMSANGPHSQFSEYRHCMTASTTLTWGRASEQAHSLQPGERLKFGTQIASVGAASLDRLFGARQLRRAGRSQRKPRNLLYATSNYYGNDWYFGMPPGYSDRLFYLDQDGIVCALSSLAERRDLDVVVKLHPTTPDPPFAHEVRQDSRCGRLSVVKAEATLTRLLDWTDAVILDLPTTSLLQAIAAGLPVFVLLRHWRHGAEGEEILARRAVCAETIDDLLQKVETFVREGHYAADIEDTEFLRAYGTHLNDTKSAERAAKIVCYCAATFASDGSLCSRPVEGP